MGGAMGLPDLPWAWAILTAGREAPATAKISQMGSKLSFFVIILGISHLFNRTCE
jgi:hypothetical protein